MILAGIILRNKYRSSHMRLILCTSDHRKDAARIEARIRSAVAKEIPAGSAEHESTVLASVRTKLFAADKANDHDTAHALAYLHSRLTGSLYGALVWAGGDEFSHRLAAATRLADFVQGIIADTE